MSLDKYYLEHLLELGAKVKVLEAKVTGQQHLINALATRLCEISPESKQRTLDLLRASATYAEFAEQPASGPFVLTTIEVAEALTNSHKVDAIGILLTKVLLAINAGPDRLPALNHWLAHAMPDEIGQEIQQLYDQLQHGKKPETD